VRKNYETGSAMGEQFSEHPAFPASGAGGSTRLVPDAKIILYGSRVREARQDSDRDFLIIADHPLDREIITELKDGLTPCRRFNSD
jgi:hypothetical protein